MDAGLSCCKHFIKTDTGGACDGAWINADGSDEGGCCPGGESIPCPNDPGGICTVRAGADGERCFSDGVIVL